MKTETTPHNPFDSLDSPEEINAYLAAAFLDEDPRVFLVALGFLARKKGLAEVARLAGVSRESLDKSLSREGNPGYATIARVIRALNIGMVPETFQDLAGGWTREEAAEFRAGIQSCEQIDEDWRK